MSQYEQLCQRIVSEGTWLTNERTGQKCLTVINAQLEYDVDNKSFQMKQQITRQLCNFRGLEGAGVKAFFTFDVSLFGCEKLPQSVVDATARGASKIANIIVVVGSHTNVQR